MKHKEHGTSACPCCNISPLQRLEQLEPIIARVGFALAPGIVDLPSGERESFTYTVGLAAHGYPELVVVGVPMDQAAHTLGPAALQLLKGELRTGVRNSSILQGLDVCFVTTPADQFGSNLQLAKLWAGRDLDCIQMVWPDAKNLLPWEKGFDERFRERQPILSQMGADVPKPPKPLNKMGDAVVRTMPAPVINAQNNIKKNSESAFAFLGSQAKPWRKLSS
jgi:hypothetical protein